MEDCVDVDKGLKQIKDDSTNLTDFEMTTERDFGGVREEFLEENIN